ALFRRGAGKEAWAFARLDRRSRQHDALHLVALERIDRAGDREIGLAGAGGADAQGQVMREDVLDVLHLMRRAAVQIGAARKELRPALVRRRGGAASLQELGEAELHVVERQLARGAVVEVLER